MVIEEFKIKSKDGRTRTKVKYECKICKQIKETNKEYINQNFTFTCRSCNNKITGKAKKGKPAKHRGKSLPHRCGKNNPAWKGGKWISSDGYVMILVKQGKLQNESGWSHYKKEHRIVMEKFLNRELSEKEKVHHINGEKQDNNIENLDLLSSDKEHRESHQSLQEIGYELYKEGKIGYDKNNHKYFRKDI